MRLDIIVYIGNAIVLFSFLLDSGLSPTHMGYKFDPFSKACIIY